MRFFVFYANEWIVWRDVDGVKGREGRNRSRRVCVCCATFIAIKTRSPDKNIGGQQHFPCLFLWSSPFHRNCQLTSSSVASRLLQVLPNRFHKNQFKFKFQRPIVLKYGKIPYVRNSQLICNYCPSRHTTTELNDEIYSMFVDKEPHSLPFHLI